MSARLTALCARASALLIALVLMVLAGPVTAATEESKDQAARQIVQPGNNAPLWRDVRGGDNPYQTTQVRGIETNILVQPGGETWRQIRNGPITLYGGILLIIVPILLYAFYRWRGPLELHDTPTGRLIERFSDWERIVHWATAISFVILAITGIIILFGKHVILPVFGYTVFSWFAIIGKNLHNFVGPLFVFCTLAMAFSFARDNLWTSFDMQWFTRGGGMIKGKHASAGRFNAGEKTWFWFGVVLLGTIVSVTGLVLDFPNFDQSRSVMQQANVIHAIAALLYMAMSMGHIYLGTIGMKGAYDAMRVGYVDETWAREHHDVWYEQVKAGTARQRFVDDVPADVRTRVGQAIA